jgi:hypothetical protein
VPGPVDRFTVALDRIRLEVRSPGGHIVVRRMGGGDIEVRVRGGTVASTPARRLAAEVRAVLRAALAAYDEAYFDARREAYGTDLGLGEEARGSA